MRKIKEVLRLKFELGVANRQIARSCSINHSTVADYLSRAKAAGLAEWPLPDGLDEAVLENRLFPVAPPRSEQPRAAPNWSSVYEDLGSRKHVTLQLVWQEYKQGWVNSGKDCRISRALLRQSLRSRWTPACEERFGDGSAHALNRGACKNRRLRIVREIRNPRFFMRLSRRTWKCSLPGSRNGTAPYRHL